VLAIVNWYLIKKVPEFKQQKIDTFSKVMAEMSSTEVQNSNLGAVYWSKVLSNSHLNRP
jgi:carbonic anhydrase